MVMLTLYNQSPLFKKPLKFHIFKRDATPPSVAKNIAIPINKDDKLMDTN